MGVPKGSMPSSIGWVVSIEHIRQTEQNVQIKTTNMIWYKLENKKPIAIEKGCWDGLRSDKMLVATGNNKIHIAVMYQGILDGCEFCDFYDDTDYKIENVVLWAEINYPF